MAQGNSVNIVELINIPISIILGIFIGAVVGVFPSAFFETQYAHRHYVRNSMRVIIVLGTAFLLIALEEWLKNVIPVSGLLAVMGMACMLQIRSVAFVSARLSENLASFGLQLKLFCLCLWGQWLTFVILWKPDLALFFCLLLRLYSVLLAFICV